MMSRIATLQDEARETGDTEMEELCERAGNGDLWAFGKIASMVAGSNAAITTSGTQRGGHT